MIRQKKGKTNVKGNNCKSKTRTKPRSRTERENQMRQYVPAFFDSLTVSQLEMIEDRAILKHDYEMRMHLRKAAKGDKDHQKEVMKLIQADHSWIGMK